MTIETTRRGFIGVGSATVLAGVGGTFALLQQSTGEQTPAAPPVDKPEFKWDRPPALKPEDVRAVVGEAHRDIDKVRALLDAQPAMVNAVWDWGTGDYESPLGAAGHTGQVEIAELVLSRGARLELHAAAMLGWLEIVKAAVAARPGAENILGPHAIPMHSHARAGEERAMAVLEYLESLNALRDLPIADDVRAKYVGRYQVEGKPEQELLVLPANRRLVLQPPQRRAWFMLNQGEHQFRPADNMKVKLTFEMAGGSVRAMHIDEGNDQAVAVRVE